MTQNSTVSTRRSTAQALDMERIVREDEDVTEALLIEALRDLKKRVAALEKGTPPRR